MSLRVDIASLADAQVCALLEAHQRDMVAISPPGTSFALDLTGLSGPGITLFGAWDGDELVAVGALKRLSPEQAEIKSMRTHARHLGKGAAQAILDRLIATARSEGLHRLSLETGTSATFAPAIRLYTRNHFSPGTAFADYANGPHNQCYHLPLAG